MLSVACSTISKLDDLDESTKSPSSWSSKEWKLKPDFLSFISEMIDPELSGIYKTSLSAYLLPRGSANVTDPVPCADTHFHRVL